jgi:hypothetical protein
MRYVLINYDSLNDEDLAGITQVKDSKIILCYSDIDEVPLHLGLELKQMKSSIEFISIKQADIAMINFNIALYMGYILKQEDLTDVVLISGDTQCVSAIKYMGADRIKLCQNVQELVDGRFMNVKDIEVFYIEKDLIKLTQDGVKKTELHHKINEQLRKNNLTDAMSKSSNILNAFISTKKFEDFKVLMCNYDYKNGTKISEALESLYIQVRNTNRI